MWVYCAVISSINSVLAAFVSLIILESLVQVTVVGGPPDELQMRKNSRSVIRVKVIPPERETLPEVISLLDGYRHNYSVTYLPHWCIALYEHFEMALLLLLLTHSDISLELEDQSP